MDKWINKAWYIHTMNYYSTLKRKEVLTHGVTWMNLEDMVSLNKPVTKRQAHMIPLI